MEGDDNDPVMFAKLQEVVEEHNVSNLPYQMVVKLNYKCMKDVRL